MTVSGGAGPNNSSETAGAVVQEPRVPVGARTVATPHAERPVPDLRSRRGRPMTSSVPSPGAPTPPDGGRVETLTIAGVRRWGENDTTPIALDTRRACGTWSDHVHRGCIAVAWDNGRGTSGTLHLTPDDALRLSDLLRAMTEPSR